MLKRTLVGLVVFGGFLLWHYGGNAAMPALADEVRMAPPADASRVTFKSGTWACTFEEFRHQVLGQKSYYAKPVVIRIVGGPPEFCREITTSHDYALLAPAPDGVTTQTPCPDHSCVGFHARVVLDGREEDWVLYAPNSFIASSR